MPTDDKQPSHKFNTQLARRYEPSSIEDIDVDMMADAMIEALSDSAAPVLIRLTDEQVTTLLSAPSRDNLVGKRDLATMSLLLMGLRKEEACSLTIEDLSYIDGHPALHVPDQPGCVERVVPFLDWAYDNIAAWVSAANFTDGYLLRGFYKQSSNKEKPPKLRKSLSPRAVENILASYPIETERGQVTVTPLVLRRTYALMLNDNNVPFQVIMDYLGLKDANSLLRYLDPVTIGRKQFDVHCKHQLTFNTKDLKPAKVISRKKLLSVPADKG